MRFSIFSTFLASLVAVDAVLAAKLHVMHAGAKGHSNRAREVAKRGENQLAKRTGNARFSFFDTGLGACGKVNKASDFVVALNHAQFDSGDHCFETITITYGGKTAQAQIVDRCVECPPGALDFTRGLFDFFGSESQGYLYGSWTFGSAPEPSPTPKTTAKPTPSTTWTPKTTSTSTKHTTSTTSSTSTTSTSTSTSASTTSSAPAATITGVLADANQILLAFAGLAIGAGEINA